eukprot:s5093_g4.t1
MATLAPLPPTASTAHCSLAGMLWPDGRSHTQGLGMALRFVLGSAFGLAVLPFPSRDRGATHPRQSQSLYDNIEVHSPCVLHFDLDLAFAFCSPGHLTWAAQERSMFNPSSSASNCCDSEYDALAWTPASTSVSSTSSWSFPLGSFRHIILRPCKAHALALALVALALALDWVLAKFLEDNSYNVASYNGLFVADALLALLQLRSSTRVGTEHHEEGTDLLAGHGRSGADTCQQGQIKAGAAEGTL